MFYTLLQKLPGGENAKVFFGVAMLCGACTLPLYARGGGARVQYDTMAEKKEAQRKEAEALGPEALAAFEQKEAVAKASYGQKSL